jgi:hypothetical protein
MRSSSVNHVTYTVKYHSFESQVRKRPEPCRLDSPIHVTTLQTISDQSSEVSGLVPSPIDIVWFFQPGPWY